DNFFTGSKTNIAHLLGHPYFELMRDGVTFPLYVEVDQIYNLACPASPVHYQRDPLQSTKTSVHGAIDMLGLSKGLKARIFQAFTSEVYLYGADVKMREYREYKYKLNIYGDALQTRSFCYVDDMIDAFGLLMES
ncbi:MAG TPA: SDR family NAD-dependent epimerase/dehydratase, partial [Thermosynechococcus sp. M3746_W2019_013]